MEEIAKGFTKSNISYSYVNTYVKLQKNVFLGIQFNFVFC